MASKKGCNGKTKKSSSLGTWIQHTQLSLTSALMNGLDPSSGPLCLIESLPTLTKFHFHKKRMVLVLSLIRHFVAELRHAGYEVYHYRLDDEKTGVLCECGEEACLEDFIKRAGIQKLRVMESTEFDLDTLTKSLVIQSGLPVELIPNDQFLVDRGNFAAWYVSLADPTMEAFYRKRRRETGTLMQEDQPLGGRWNYDADNRVPPTGNMPVPDSPAFPPDDITLEVIHLVEERFPDHVGDTSDFSLPVTRTATEYWLEDFLQHRLRLFGMYQDAMLTKSSRMYHSCLSPYMNLGVLHPAEVLRKVEEAYIEGEAPINSVEGFIRQVMGWREYLHGVYWMRMPDYREENYLSFHRSIPAMMQTGDTNLRCLSCVIDQSKREAYAHHIQRLMIVGNFALLIGVEPKELVRWMMEMYIDAAEWAALPNVMGMTLYADGGQLGSKPYAASAHYTDKMSDYCHGCHYRERKRVGEKACPLNFLYWNFVGTYQELLKHNPRMQTAIQMYRHKPQAERNLIESSSKEFLQRIEELGTDRRLKKKALR